MIEKPNYQQLKKLIAERSAELTEKLDATCANLMIPVDGQGLRILASVPEGESKPGLTTVNIETEEGIKFDISIEVRQDFSPVKPHSVPPENPTKEPAATREQDSDESP